MAWSGGTQSRSFFDNFSIPPNSSSEPNPSGLEALCQVTAASSSSQGSSGTVLLLPGVEALDLYATSRCLEIWKDGRAVPCQVPEAVIGWEFYCLLWPQPTGSSQLRLSSSVELMVGRPPGGRISPSLIFALVPPNHIHSSSLRAVASRRRPGAAPPRLVQTCERLQGNLDVNNRTLKARLLVLCPSSVYMDANELPDEQNWGLFIGPRSRSLVLLNKERGRIDLHLAVLLTVDSAFNLCSGLIAATSRLFEPFGTQNQVAALFGRSPDPLKVHSGLTNAVVCDHVDITLDGRDDYFQVFGVRLPTFFLSNASCNLLFLTPLEAHELRAGASSVSPTQTPCELRDIPFWTMRGHVTEDDCGLLLAYRSRVPVPATLTDSSMTGSIMQLLGWDRDGKGDGWFSLVGCSDVTMATSSSSAVVESRPKRINFSPAPSPTGGPPANPFGIESMSTLYRGSSRSRSSPGSYAAPDFATLPVAAQLPAMRPHQALRGDSQIAPVEH